MHKTKIAILATGGIDSTVLMYMNRYKDPTIITIDYGHKAFAKQIELLEHHTENLSLDPPMVIKIEYKEWQKKSGLFKDGYVPAEDAPLKDWEKLRYEDFFIEGRNMIMVAYALSYCSSMGIDELLAGYLYSQEEWENRRSYKLMTGDNSPQFVDMMNMLTSVGLSHQVRFRAPFYELKWDKRRVIFEGKVLYLDFEKTYSCYFVPECGVCDNCLLRKELLKSE